MTKVDLVTVRLTWVETLELSPAPHLLRGAVAARFPENPLFHQHEGGRVVYRYPLIQYRWDREGPLLMGLGEGARFLSRVDWAGMELRLGDRLLTVRDAVCTFRRASIQPAPSLLRYRLVTPWLPFSQESFERYRQLSLAEQAADRDRLAVAGVLLALRGWRVDFPGRLYAAFELRAARSCRYKDVRLLGFEGTLLANVDVPDGFSFGRAVSRGYGWLCRDSATVPEGRCDDTTPDGAAG
jgi:hypothetical protein